MIVYLDRSEVPDLEQVPSGVIRWLIRRAELAELAEAKLTLEG